MGEILVEACRRDNIDLIKETLEGKSEQEIADLLNNTTTVMGNHLYHEAAANGNCTSWPIPFFFSPAALLPFAPERPKIELETKILLSSATPLQTTSSTTSSTKKASSATRSTASRATRRCTPRCGGSTASPRRSASSATPSST